MESPNLASARSILLISGERPEREDFRRVFDAARDPAGPWVHQNLELHLALDLESGLTRLRGLAENAPFLVAFVNAGAEPAAMLERLRAEDPHLQIVLLLAAGARPHETLLCCAAAPGVLLLSSPLSPFEILGLSCRLSEQALTLRLAQDREQAYHRSAMFDERVRQSLLRVRRDPEHALAVLFLDIDRFKLINDSLGSELGEQVLDELRRRAQSCLRPADLLSRECGAARLGGDELVILLDGIRRQTDAARVAGRLNRLLAEPYKVGERVVHLSVSIGIATSEGADPDPAALVRDAETALRRAKEQGRARFVFFDRGMQEQARPRLDLEESLRKCQDAGQLVPCYQRIIDCSTGRTVGFEALLRKRLPDGALVSLASEIPVLDEMGLLLPITLQVLAQAAQQVTEWQERFQPEPRFFMSVNLPRTCLRAPELPRLIDKALRSGGVELSDIVFDISEFSLLDKPKAMEATLSEIRQMGFRLHLDDFGPGLLSLGSLQGLSFEAVKLDRGHLRGGFGAKERRALLRAILDLVHTLHLRVVAEGVETTDDALLLRESGCDLMQGYLFGPALPPARLEQYLLGQNQG